MSLSFVARLTLKSLDPNVVCPSFARIYLFTSLRLLHRTQSWPVIPHASPLILSRCRRPFVGWLQLCIVIFWTFIPALRTGAVFVPADNGQGNRIKMLGRSEEENVGAQRETPAAGSTSNVEHRTFNA